jgi:hydrogenase maturation protein HypF
MDHGPVLVRRARGWVPEPLPLPIAPPEPVLAVGGHLQVTACVAVDGQAFLSQHVGDLDSIPARAFLTEVIEGLERFLDVRPALVVCDAHPDYPSSWLARELAEGRHGRLLPVQHHLAHGAAVLAEHQRWPEASGPALVLALDGTGWGPDGTAWGGEWLLLGDDLEWHRAGHLQPLPLVGGERAVREPWRVAAAALSRAGAEDLLLETPLARSVDSGRLRELARLATASSWPLASGAGRLFEAGGALLGLVTVNDWEGEAAVALESLAASAGTGEPWPEVVLDLDAPLPSLPSQSLLVAAARRLVDGHDPARIAAGFHATFCALSVALSGHIVDQTGATVVAMGGGCLVNRVLARGLATGIESLGVPALLPRQVPPGDGGLAYGQAVLAAVGMARGVATSRWCTVARAVGSGN